MDDLEIGFNLKVVLVSFKQCLDEKEEVLLDFYIVSWKGLVRFLNSLGIIFLFIFKDVVFKLQIMECFRGGLQSEYYCSLQIMVVYELSNQLVDLEYCFYYFEFGCWIVLCLYCVLCWLQLFLEGLCISFEDICIFVFCIDFYNVLLVVYYFWIVCCIVIVVFYVLFICKVFLEVMNVGFLEQVVQMLGEVFFLLSVFIMFFRSFMLSIFFWICFRGGKLGFVVDLGCGGWG